MYVCIDNFFWGGGTTEKDIGFLEDNSNKFKLQ